MRAGNFHGGVSVVHPVLVAADMTQECFLGIDFLDKLNTTIDLNGKSIKIGKEAVGLKGKNELWKVFQISLVEIVVVPGRPEIISPPKFKGAVCADDVLGIVDLFQGFVEQHDLFLARVMAQPKHNMVPVRVNNLSPTPVTLYQKTTVGTFSQLEDRAL